MNQWWHWGWKDDNIQLTVQVYICICICRPPCRSGVNDGGLSLSSLWRGFGPLVLAALLQLIQLCSIRVRTASQPGCMQCMDLCPADDPVFSKFSQWLQSAQTLIPPPPCWQLLWGVWFPPNVVLCIMDRHFYFGLVCQEDFVPDVLWFVHMQLWKPKACCHVRLG